MPVRLSDDILLKVEKPARYTGHEWNMIRKDPASVDMRFAFCFPDTYEVGMSNLGMKILYHLMNERADTYCERVFAPWTDMEEKMRLAGIPLFALETRDPIVLFDMVGFTLQYEMSYTNILNMLDLAGIPILAKERGENFPLLCAGGPCAFNPEPLAPIFDFFFIGEAEEAILEIIDVYLNCKRSKKSKHELLNALSRVEGVYVPELFDAEHASADSSTIVKVRKRSVRSLDGAFFPDRIIVPNIGIVHDRVMLEIFRGCTRGCRFCQAGFIYRPVRERSAEKLADLAGRLIANTGYDEVSLSSLSTSDYSSLETLAAILAERFESQRVSLSLPSLRIDSFSAGLMEKVKIVRKSGITFAPEAGTQRLRDVINKGVSEEDLLSSAKIAFEGGWNNIKLYFMIGLPTETDEDIKGIADLARKVAGVFYAIPGDRRRNALNITISIATFVPKPHTPFQWEPQAGFEQLMHKIAIIKASTRAKYINLNWHDPKLSIMEGVFARGDRRVCDVLIKAWGKGCRFDGWDEHFNYDMWMSAFTDCNIDPAFYTERFREIGGVMPWSHIDSGVSEKYLIEERVKAYKGERTADCRTACAGCGISRFSECG